MDTDSLLHQVLGNDSVIGYVLISPDGVPIKHHDRMPYETAVLYASLVTDFYLRSSIVMKELMGADPTSSVKNFSFRTAKQTEIIVSACNEYVLAVIQNCSGKAWVWEEEAKETS